MPTCTPAAGAAGPKNDTADAHGTTVGPGRRR